MHGFGLLVQMSHVAWSVIKSAFHHTDIDTGTEIFARILADTSDTRDRFPEVIPVAS